MKSLRNIANAVYYCLPVQLVIVQVRYAKLELLIWVLMFMVVTNNFGNSFGLPFLFLEPEYMGETGWYSMFLLGVGVGTFIAAYIISSYISNAYRFGFLALEYRPFFVFSFNNTLIPFAYLITYSVCYIQYQMYSQQGFNWSIIGDLTGIFLGIFMVTILIFVYFFNTNKNYVVKLGEKVVRDLKGKRVIVEKAKAGMGVRIRVDSFFASPVQIRKADLARPIKMRQLVRTMNQNHGNALFFELLLLLAILTLGLMEHNPYFIVPAGVSIFLFASVILMLVSAFTFWFRKIGPLFLVIVVVGYVVLNQIEINKYKHPAIGMNYDAEPARYEEELLKTFSSKENIEQDLATTRGILERWKSDYQVFNGPYKKPKAVIVCTSGGGLRSAYFTTRTLQKLDSLTDGKFLDRTRFLTGASGGMVGAAYWRELRILNSINRADSIYDIAYAQRMAKDLLNRVSIKIVTGFFLPSLPKKFGQSTYPDDRGYSFEEQLLQNLGVFRNRRLSDYTPYEEGALTPMMVFCPVIINDGRKLYVSSTNVSYFTRNIDYDGELEEAVTGVEFRRFFRENDADSINFPTVLRMNASFPAITPYVRLPSEPVLQVMDAGIADNYGLETANRFLGHFGDWLRRNTSGVMLLQIRDSRSVTMKQSEYSSRNSIQELLNPIGGTYRALNMSADLVNDEYLHSMKQSMRGELDIETIFYEEDTSGFRASLSWHLTRQEIVSIEESLNNELNWGTMDRIRKWLADE